MNENLKNPLLCDPESGICEIPGAENSQTSKFEIITNDKKPIKLIYFTDPICSGCWGMEPQLRLLKLEYGHLLDIEYRMGGLLKDWNSYNRGGISGPEDVGNHWVTATKTYDMPLDGDLWKEDPPTSSYPASIAFKAAQLQSEKLAINFLREVREMIFMFKKNVMRREHLEIAAQRVGLDMAHFQADFDGIANDLFELDLMKRKAMNVRGLPSLFFINAAGKQALVYAVQPYSDFLRALHEVYPQAQKADYNKSWQFLFSQYNSMTAREYAELSGTARNSTEAFLNQLTREGSLHKRSIENGSIWNKI